MKKKEKGPVILNILGFYFAIVILVNMLTPRPTGYEGYFIPLITTIVLSVLLALYCRVRAYLNPERSNEFKTAATMIFLVGFPTCMANELIRNALV